MFIASLLAVFEPNLKRMLAYSSVAQIGYITLGIGLANQAGLTGGHRPPRQPCGDEGARCSWRSAPIFYRVGIRAARRPRRHRPQMPLTMAAFVDRRSRPHRHARHRRLHLQMVPGGRRARQKGWWPLVFLIVASSLIALVYIGRVVEVAWFREPSAAGAEGQGPAALHAAAAPGPRRRRRSISASTRERSAGIASTGRASAARRAQ